MSRDPLAELSTRLFAAAREERAPEGAERRAFEHVRRESRAMRSAAPTTRRFSTVAAFAGLAGLAGLALLLVVLSKRERPELSIAAEHPSSTRRIAPQPSVASPAPEAPAEMASLPASARPKTSASPRLPPATLSEELDALKVAERALSASEPQKALAALDHYDRTLKGQKLRAEATLLRIEALARSGQREAAAAMATRFAEQNPTSPLVDRARSFIPSESGGSEHE